MNELLLKQCQKAEARYKKTFGRRFDKEMIRFILVSPIGEFPDTNITQCFASWETLNFEQMRRGTTGVDMQASGQLEFVWEAKNILRILYNTHGLSAQARLDIYLNKNRFEDLELTESVNLNFETYSLTPTKVIMGASSDRISDFIKSRGSTKYDIPVSDVAFNKQWRFDRLRMLSSLNYQLPEYTGNDDGGAKYDINGDNRTFTPDITFISGETVPDGTNHTGSSQYFKPVRNDNNEQFFRAQEDGVVDFRMKVKVNVTTQIGGGIFMRLAENDPNSSTSDIWYPIQDYQIDEREGDEYFFKYLDINREISVKKDHLYRIQFYLNGAEPGGSIDGTQFWFSDFEVFDVRWREKGKTKYIDIVHPQTFGQALLDKISEQPGRFTCQIEWEWSEMGVYPFTIAMLVAAESLRSVQNPTFHASFNDFKNWLRCLGYEFNYVENTVVFRRRDKFYDKDIKAMDIKLKENAKFRVEADREFAYSAFKVGYNKVDYSNTNGRFEFNTTFDYTTGYTTPNPENILSLISPYRADSMGFEFLIQESLNKTKDDKSDNDIFVVALEAQEEYFVTSLRETPVVEGDFELFNSVFSPNRLALYNESLLGINSKQLTFTGTDGNRTAVIKETGTPLYNDIPINKRLHYPTKYIFNVGTRKYLPPMGQRNGVVTVDFQGVLFTGYIHDIVRHYGRNSVVEWELYQCDEEKRGTPRF